MFIDYQSKPITRKAHKITERDEIHKVEGEEATYTLLPYDSTEPVNFAAYEPVATGDYVVYLNENDIYHCSAKVFAERNIA